MTETRPENMTGASPETQPDGPADDFVGQKRVLVHICCGPCAIHPVRELMDQGFEAVGLYLNPNIHPLTEYLRRRDGVAEVADRLGLQVIYKDNEYRPKEYFRRVAHREQNRCFHCYSMRLERTASIASKGGFGWFTTTLLYSKFQKHGMIAGLGRDFAAGGKAGFLYQDFRQGWAEGVRVSHEWSIYRQQYCGCLYSEFERYEKEL